jgi:hypothetical protein
MASPLDQPAELRRISDQFARYAFQAPDSEEFRAVICDELHPWSLQRQFPLANVHRIPGPTAASTAVCIVHADYGLGFLEGLPTERLGVFLVARRDDEPHEERFAWLYPGGALLLMAIHEALMSVAVAEREFTGLEPDLLAAHRIQLVELCNEVVNGLEVTAGYRRLTNLFGSAGWRGSTDSIALGQLNAVATMAIRRWMARRARGSRELQVDLVQRLFAATGARPRTLDDEYALRFPTGELAFRIERGVIVGRGRGVNAEGRFVSSPLACSAHTLEWVAWAMAARDEVSGDVAQALARFVVEAIKHPWLDIQAATEPIFGLLTKATELRGRRHRRTAAAALTILERRPRVDQA